MTPEGHPHLQQLMWGLRLKPTPCPVGREYPKDTLFSREDQKRLFNSSDFTQAIGRGFLKKYLKSYILFRQQRNERRQIPIAQNNHCQYCIFFHTLSCSLHLDFKSTRGAGGGVGVPTGTKHTGSSTGDNVALRRKTEGVHIPHATLQLLLIRPLFSQSSS